MARGGAQACIKSKLMKPSRHASSILSLCLLLISQMWDRNCFKMNNSNLKSYRILKSVDMNSLWAYLKCFSIFSDSLRSYSQQHFRALLGYKERQRRREDILKSFNE